MTPSSFMLRNAWSRVGQYGRALLCSGGTAWQCCPPADPLQHANNHSSLYILGTGGRRGRGRTGAANSLGAANPSCSVTLGPESDYTVVLGPVLQVLRGNASHQWIRCNVYKHSSLYILSRSHITPSNQGSTR